MSLELSQEVIDKLAERGRKSLFFFTRAILGFDKVTKSIHIEVTNALMDYVSNKRMKIVFPRDWYKTTICSIAYPIWRAINNPEVRILLVQNTYTNAVSKLGAIKQIFEKNQLFRALYPEILPVIGCKWKGDSLCVNRVGTFPESTFEGAGTSTATTSRHYDIIIEDDTVAPDFDNMTGMLMQPTKSQIEKAIGWHKLAHPLLIEPAESQILVVGTRWTEADLLDWIEQNEDYTTISRSCLEDEAGLPDELGKPTWEYTDDGRPKFTLEVLEQLKNALGPYMFSALYLNLPTAASNQVFKQSFINYYNNLPSGLLYCTTHDPASATEDSSSDPDYSVTLTTGINPKNGHIYIVHYTRERVNPGAVINTLFEHFLTFKPLRFRLEAISYQRTLAYWITQRQNERNIFFPIEEVTGHKASKTDRIKGLVPYFAATRIFVRRDMPELESELLSFPRGRHDDVIDALSMHLPFWIECIEKVEHEYKRKYVFGSAAQIIDSIKARYKKARGFPYDVGNFRYREEYKHARRTG